MRSEMCWWRWATIPFWFPLLVVVAVLSAVTLCIGCPETWYAKLYKDSLDG